MNQCYLDVLFRQTVSRIPTRCWLSDLRHIEHGTLVVANIEDSDVDLELIDLMNDCLVSENAYGVYRDSICCPPCTELHSGRLQSIQRRQLEMKIACHYYTLNSLLVLPSLLEPLSLFLPWKPYMS